MNGHVVFAPAKINLFLELIKKRDDGFHELETVMSCVNLCDRLQFWPQATSQISLREINAATGMPANEDNLIVRALQLLKAKTGCTKGMYIEIEKRIPIQAGLGGASSDAAAALTAGNRLWKLGLDTQQLLDLAAILGSDVPFFVTGGTAVCKGRGEIVTPIDNLNSFPILIAKPPVGLSTPHVFSNSSIANTPQSSAPLIDAFRMRNKNAICETMINRLEIAAAKVSDWGIRMDKAFQDMECVAHQLSGSGSCYFGLFSNSKLLRKAAAMLLQREPELALYYCQSIGRLAHQFPSME